MRKIFQLPFYLCTFIIIGYLSHATAAVHFYENFSGSFPSTYSTGTYVLGSGSWEINQVQLETAANSVGAFGGAARLKTNVSGGSYVITPSMNSVGTVTFQYRELNAIGGGSFTVQKSINGGPFMDIGTQVFSGIAYAPYTANVNDASNNIRIRILFQSTTTYLIIDEMTITDYVPGPTLNTNVTSLSGFTYYAALDLLPLNTSNISGSGLTGAPGSITVTASTNYEVSIDNTSFGITLTSLFQVLHYHLLRYMCA
jgi:hypothetical protein